ncbi:hypothetical protein GOP47_0017557 [Adiantum capillus-veneris]|uniref:Polygalacturonase n=1 Tax=Adiantum capillus-veneris TaxID=13818 RepID=A0A9D4Z9T0_ADICA|nr:hypothetical protein GOP47_0017557 [Adiantum capillus-veneris]
MPDHPIANGNLHTIRLQILVVVGVLGVFYVVGHSQLAQNIVWGSQAATKDRSRERIEPETTANTEEWNGACGIDKHGPPKRAVRACITEYGGVGDGRTLNTAAFQKAIAALANIEGGAQLHVPAGHWLTGCFNLTSHLTLYLERGALILGSQNTQDWPLIEPLPSYGSGRERPGKRHTSLLHGKGLVDIWITGDNGTIDGQGGMWWEMWKNRTLVHTRGHLLEFISSQNIVLSNVVLRNSPFWTVHPVYCNNLMVKNVTILAPWDAPNTDGIDPDSSSNVCIEDCYISNGDDLVSIKSGWDEYGLQVARPSINITVRRVIGTTATCSGISIGSEVSGGIENVLVEDLLVFNAAAGIRLKTAPGRGGYVKNVTIKNVKFQRVKRAIEFSGDAGEHPKDVGGGGGLGSSLSDFSKYTAVAGIFIQNVVGTNIVYPGRFISTPQAPFVDICLFNISLDAVSSWSCSFVHGSSSSVIPPLCPPLASFISTSASCNLMYP